VLFPQPFEPRMAMPFTRPDRQADVVQGRDLVVVVVTDSVYIKDRIFPSKILKSYLPCCSNAFPAQTEDCAAVHLQIEND